jgi:hypothetical protein
MGAKPGDGLIMRWLIDRFPEIGRSSADCRLWAGGSDRLLSGFPGSQALFAGNLDQPAFLAGFSVEMMSSRRYESTPTSRCLLRNPGGRSGVASAAGTITGAAVS